MKRLMIGVVVGFIIMLGAGCDTSGDQDRMTALLPLLLLSESGPLDIEYYRTAGDGGQVINSFMITNVSGEDATYSIYYAWDDECTDSDSYTRTNAGGGQFDPNPLTFGRPVSAPDNATLHVRIYNGDGKTFFTFTMGRLTECHG